MDHYAAKLNIRYENDWIILRGEPTLIHQEAERIIDRLLRCSDRPQRLRNGQADRIELIPCGG